MATKNSGEQEQRQAALLGLAEQLQMDEPRRLAVLRQALTHATWFEGKPHQAGDYQRLEFLGDAVLDQVIGTYLYCEYPLAAEGELSKMRALIVCEASLAAAAKRLGLDKALLLGHGALLGGEAERPSVLADVFEAVSGAIFIERGYEAARDFLIEQFAPAMQGLTREDYEDKKSALQELVQKYVNSGVNYQVLKQSGPDHLPHFVSAAYCGREELGRGEGGSKKESELAAARAALQQQQRWLPKIIARFNK
ncbi:MAG: ribonuclease III [Bacillota bacterium]|nr:ribonuclease III [Bacillota bacterium]